MMIGHVRLGQAEVAVRAGVDADLGTLREPVRDVAGGDALAGRPWVS
jgi:hypothetical protein